MPHNTSDCTSISIQCPVDLTIYGYYPNLVSNAFFCAYFGLFTIANVILGLRYRKWVFASFVTLGCLGETIGYVGRIIMHGNPWSSAGFETQICTLIFSPSFIAAAIYMSLKDTVRAVGPQFSSIKPVLYPWIFMICDLLSLVLQAAGGGVAASATTDSGSAIGGRIMLAGIVFQVATFTILYGMTVAFILNVKRNKSTLTTEGVYVLTSKGFKVFAIGLLVSSAAIYVRCVYRISELATGWANPIMRDEASFIVLDGVMCCIAVLALTVCYPGIFFKFSSQSIVPEEEKGVESDSSV